MNQSDRLQVIQYISKNWSLIGRVKLIKILFLLQWVKGIPFGYQFSIFTYGPFDSQILEDIDAGKNDSILNVKLVQYPSNWGYSIEPGEKSLDPVGSDIEVAFKELLAAHKGATARDMELLTTIVFVAKSTGFENDQVRKEELATNVHDIKPHFSPDEIMQEIEAAIQLRYIG